jgi:heptosyltransferase-3/putative inorganic carbon (HCO3(-)) transporter
MANTTVALPDVEGGNQAGSARSAGTFIWTAQGAGLALLTFMSFFPALFHLEEYLFFALLAVALWTGWREKRAVWIRSPIEAPLLLLVGWVLLTVPFATDPWYSFAEWRKLVAQVLVFYWALLVLRARSDGSPTRGVLAAVVIATAVLCAYALVDFGGRGGSWKDRAVRAFAPSSDSNWLSTYLVIAIPLVASLVVILRVWWKRFAAAVVLALALVAQVFTYNRAAWLALVAQGVTYGLCTGRRRFAVWVLGGCMAIGLGLVLASQVGYQSRTVDPYSLNLRLALWEPGITAIAEHPLVGLGYGDYTFTAIPRGFTEYDRPVGLHNTFLMVAVGSGIPALVFLLWTLLAIVRASLRRWRTSADQWEQAVAIGLVLVVIGFTVRNFFAYMFAGSLAYLFWILVATGLSVETRADK